MYSVAKTGFLFRFLKVKKQKKREKQKMGLKK